jgi:hypothetical protein
MGVPLVSQGRTDAEPEADGPDCDAQGDTDKGADRRSPCLVVHDESDDHSSDDRCDQEPAEACKVTPPQGVLGSLVAHVAGPLS